MRPYNFLSKIGIYLLFALLLSGFYYQKEVKPQTHVVEIINMKFQPEELQVRKGDTVVWINKDLVAHDVTETGKNWASPTLVNGSSWKKEISKNENYFCSIHLIMRGKILLVE